ncbi:hypothetical protein FHS16_005920 [Paenibacillus endophyticus]|uniref:Uncharacterized protein n=1 Tax=Paenibacillus endophyticus TaxID=1294268 RepID=A0A7W5CEJ7_9BACL|nr:hypothetical protein [Paenibacillus endophyticus]MBB3155804.1 hypothetical protein [Paenibacillus endophyticus]
MTIKIGIEYYPEQWTPELCEKDAALMQETVLLLYESRSMPGAEWRRPRGIIGLNGWMRL